MSKIKDLIMDAEEMGIHFSSNDEMIDYFIEMSEDTRRGEQVFSRIVKELSTQE